MIQYSWTPARWYRLNFVTLSCLRLEGEMTSVLEDGHYKAKESGTAGDQMRVNVLEDCMMDLSQVFSE